MSRTKVRGKCHNPLATPCGDGFVAEVRNRGKKFVTEEGTLTSSKGSAKFFEKAGDALSVAEAYINAYFSN